MRKDTATPPLLSTNRLIVRLPIHQDVPAIVHYYCSNRRFLTPFEPTRPEEFFTEKFWRLQVERSFLEFSCDQSLRLFLFDQNVESEVFGVINFNQFFRGPAQSCVVGYSLAQTKQGNGYMQEALAKAIQYVFDELNFYRIAANYMPRNQRSGNLLRRLGFVVEGYARDYLFVNGKWEDHILTGLLNSHWSAN